MNTVIYPPKLKKWSHIRVIAPVRSLKLIWDANKELSIKALEDFWFKVSFWKNVYECDEFNSSSIQSRIQDLHKAFLDKSVDAIFTVIWGYNSNQLLKYIDYDIIKNNPKILCWFSDVTALSIAIFAKTGLVWYSWPHFSSWGMQKWFEYTKEYFEKCCMQDGEYNINPSADWSDDLWFIDQDNRDFIKNDWYWIINEWKASWTLLWWHIPCIESLNWTEFFPEINNNIVLFIETDADFSNELFDRNLQSLIHQPFFHFVKWIVIGRFQKNNNMTKELLQKIIFSKNELKNIPVIWNVDFGHTTPFFTFPIGWKWIIDTTKQHIINILEH